MKIYAVMSFIIAIMVLNGNCEYFKNTSNFADTPTPMDEISKEKTLPTNLTDTNKRTQKSKKRPGVDYKIEIDIASSLLNSSLNSVENSNSSKAELMESTMNQHSSVDNSPVARVDNSTLIMTPEAENLTKKVTNNNNDTEVKFVVKKQENQTSEFVKPDSKKMVDNYNSTGNFNTSVSGNQTDLKFDNVVGEIGGKKVNENKDISVSLNNSASSNLPNDNATHNEDSSSAIASKSVIKANDVDNGLTPEPSKKLGNETALNDTAAAAAVPMNSNDTILIPLSGSNNVSALGKPSTASVEDEGNNYQSSNTALIVAVLIVISVCSLVGFIAYKRLHSYWYRRHYSKVDYLIDGLYEM